MDAAGIFGSERRRQSEPEHAAALRRGLTAQQLGTLVTLEGFRWTLASVRRPLFRDPVAVAFDRGGERHVVIEADDGIDAQPGLVIRK